MSSSAPVRGCTLFGVEFVCGVFRFVRLSTALGGVAGARCAVGGKCRVPKFGFSINFGLSLRYFKTGRKWGRPGISQ